MNEFWLWFWRPIAEFMGGIAMLVAIIVVSVVTLVLIALFSIAIDAIRFRWLRFKKRNDPPLEG